MPVNSHVATYGARLPGLNTLDERRLLERFMTRSRSDSTASSASTTWRQGTRHASHGRSNREYPVGFLDMAGNTVAVVALPASALHQPTAADLLLQVVGACALIETRSR